MIYVSCRFIFDPISWRTPQGKSFVDIATYTKLLLASGMYSESFFLDNDYTRNEITGKKILSKKIALYVDPNFLENFGVQDIKPEVSPATAHNKCLHNTHLGDIDVHHQQWKGNHSPEWRDSLSTESYSLQRRRRHEGRILSQED